MRVADEDHSPANKVRHYMVVRGEAAGPSQRESVMDMTIGIDVFRKQRLDLLNTLIEAWIRQAPGQHTDFLVVERDDDYTIRHPKLGSAGMDLTVSRSDIDALVKAGYLSMEPREEPGIWTVSIPYQGFDVFDARLGERARPEFERRIIFDLDDGDVAPAERIVDLQGHVYTLSASPRQDRGDWAARIVRYSLSTGAPAFQRPILDHRSEIHDQAAILTTMRGAGPTATAALGDLEARLRVEVGRALRGDEVSGSNG